MEADEALASRFYWFYYRQLKRHLNIDTAISVPSGGITEMIEGTEISVLKAMDGGFVITADEYAVAHVVGGPLLGPEFIWVLAPVGLAITKLQLMV